MALAAWTFWVGAILTVAGLLFTVWARIYIGTNWSGVVTIKQDHELVTTDP
jgi:protein-S-isoprenylcysteine O-methyltransferase Ste14